VRSGGAAVLVLLLAVPVSTVSSQALAATAPPVVDGGFCADRPSALDSRIATAVNALGVSPLTTAPIAVLDTGISDDAPELAGRLVSPFDATSGGNDASDVSGHGTEVAAIAAGAPGLVQGVSSMSPVMPVRVFNRSGDSTPQWLVSGINWAASNGAGVIMISSATPATDVGAADTAALSGAITDAFNKGVIVVASAGNDGSAAAEIPASLLHVVTVGASDLSGNRSTFSNVGPWVDLVAPAASLVAPTSSAYCPSGYGVANGTAFAAPSVAGAAALVGALRPALTVQQRVDLLASSARDVDPTGRDPDTGFGLLDVGRALQALAPTAEASREVDDDIGYVRGANVAGHPTLLTSKRKIRIAGRISAAKDPADVYPVRLKKNERLTVSAEASGADALIALGIWKPGAGDFDVTNEVSKNEVVSTGGFANDPALKTLAKKSGTYYVSVEAPDAVDPDDPTDIAPEVAPYQLSLSKVAVKPKPKKKRASKRRGRA
jgi:hypothetical protein